MGIFRYTSRSLGREIAFILFAVIFFVPAYVLTTLSLKTQSQTYLEPLAFPRTPRWSNYSEAWQQGGSAGLGNAMTTSLIITIGSVVCLIVLGSLCAYAIARRQSRLGTILYVLVVLAIVLPFQLAIIPTYVMFQRLHLTGTYFGMILLYTGLLMPLTVFLYAGFIRALPKEYEEAAQVDGAGLIRTWSRVVFPLLLPVTGTVAIINGLFVWNDFFLPLIYLLGSGHETLPLALYSFVGEYTAQWNLIMTAIVIAIAPILAFYVFAQRSLIKGFGGGIKG
jgi:raffinose/stachyose/melibiose transport system permease protein